MLINIEGFAGKAPRSGPSRLQGNQAQVATNCDLYAGELRGLSRMSSAAIIRGYNDVRSIYKVGDYWLFWNEAANVHRAPIVDDSYGRYYFTTPSLGARTFIATDITEADNGNALLDQDEVVSRPLGIPAPTGTPTVSASGGAGDIIDSRVYVFTFVSDRGEEGGPSPASAVIDCRSADTVSVGGMGTSAPTGYSEIITKKRIYRSLTGRLGAQFQFVAEVDIDDATFSDDLRGDELGEVLPSEDWDAPPSGLQGMVALPGGIFAGFVGNEVFFSEPYMPHAWPLKWALSVAFDVVALGVIGNTVVVATTANPYLISCPHPSEAVVTQIPDSVPCVSSLGLGTILDGVLLPSSDGLYLVNGTGCQLVTKDLFTRDEWQAIIPTTLTAFTVNGKYIAFTEGTDSGFMLDLTEQNARYVDLSLTAYGGYLSPADDNLFLVFPSGPDSRISMWEANPTFPYPYGWKSKQFVTNEPVNMAAAQVVAEYPPVVSAEDYAAQQLAMMSQYEAAILAGTFTGSMGGGMFGADMPLAGDVRDTLNAEYQVPTYMTFKFYVDGELAHTQAVSSEESFPLAFWPGGRRFEVEVSGSIPVQNIRVATSEAELAT